MYECASQCAYLSPMGWSCIYSRCSTSWMVTWIHIPLDEIFLIPVDIRFSKGYRKSGLFEIIFLPY